MVGLLIMLILNPQVFADYPKGEKPVWGLVSDTAYPLRSQGFNLSVLGWLTYGYSDRLQIGTNFLADIFQVYNAYWKYHFFDEKDNFPALSIGAIHYYSHALDNKGWMTDLALNFTKDLGGESTLYGGVSRFSTTSLLVNLIRGGASESMTGRVGIIINNASNWHSFAEAGIAVTRLTLKDFAFGVEWVSDALPFRLKLGVYFPTLIFVPIVDISWRF